MSAPPTSKPSNWAIFLYEFLGTGIMVYAYNCVPGSQSTNPQSIVSSAVRVRPLAYLIMWIIAYKVSGAQFNPATSMAVLIAGKSMNILSFLGYFIA